MFWPVMFALGLCAAIILCHARQDGLLRRSAYVLAGNYVACNAAVQISGSHDPVIWFAAIDAASAVVMLWHPAARVQAIIGAIYVMQLGVHFAQWPGGTAVGGYVNILSVGGGLQIVFLIMGAIYGDGRKSCIGGGVRGGDDRALAHGSARVGKRSGP